MLGIKMGTSIFGAMRQQSYETRAARERWEKKVLEFANHFKGRIVLVSWRGATEMFYLVCRVEGMNTLHGDGGDSLCLVVFDLIKNKEKEICLSGLEDIETLNLAEEPVEAS